MRTGKLKNVTSVFKKSKVEHIGNYRLVNLTSVPRKAVEQIVLETIFKHLVDKKVSEGSMHEFKKGKSCLTYLDSLCSEVVAQWMSKEQWIFLTWPFFFLMVLTEKLLRYGLGKWPARGIEN